MEQNNGRSNLKILVIDDNLDDVKLMLRTIGKEYHVSYQQVDNEPALLVALEDREGWDIILCDYRLPKLEPERILEILAEQRVSAPLIVISGSVQEDVAVHLISKGARDFISKDNWDRLTLAVKRELRQISEKRQGKRQIEEAYDATIEAWGEALELRDIYTRGHTQRVTTLALRLGRVMNVSHDDFIALNRGALLHDIGKMGIPDAVLLKNDYLTNDEMEIMKAHTVIGRRMLRKVPFLQEAAEITYLHHERWNGTGYPLGLEGEAIPFLARLFAVVDVYDALVSHRPYRPSWEKSKAIAFLLDERGVTFDPKVVDAFVNMVGRG